jgi:hypothetical protein
VKKDEKQFLLERVFAKKNRTEPEADTAILKLLAQKYPDEFIKLWKEHVGKDENSSFAFMEALHASKISKNEQDSLLLSAAKTDSVWWRYHSSFQLTKHPEAPALVITWLEGLPKTPKEAYWQAPVGRYAQVACGFDNDQVWEALAKTAKRVDLGQRLEILGKVGGGRQRGRQIALYRQFLGDSEERTLNHTSPKDDDLFSGPGAGFTFDRLKAGDFAAYQLGHLFKLKQEPDSTWKEADWKAFHAEVATVLKKYDEEQKQKEKRP